MTNTTTSSKLGNLPSNNNRKVLIDGVPFSCSSWAKILDAMETQPSDSHNYISITNTESLHFAFHDPEHKNYIQNAYFSCCDGVAIVLAAKLNGVTIPRLHGPDLLLNSCEFGQDKNWRHFFYGGKDGVPEVLSKNLIKKYPKIQIAGTYSPPFRRLTEQEDLQIIQMINESNPDIVWVGLGLLKQEQWIAEHLSKVHARWMIGVGAAFDFYAGTTTRAPIWVQNLGLEWLYRVLKEPRMWIRLARSLKLFAKISVTKRLYKQQ